jgi:hypothetical protein
VCTDCTDGLPSCTRALCGTPSEAQRISALVWCSLQSEPLLLHLPQTGADIVMTGVSDGSDGSSGSESGVEPNLMPLSMGVLQWLQMYAEGTFSYTLHG